MIFYLKSSTIILEDKNTSENFQTNNLYFIYGTYISSKASKLYRNMRIFEYEDM